MTTYLYRVLETDADGDPIDFGVVRASDPDQAWKIIVGRLQTLGVSGKWPVRLYPTLEVPCGVFGCDGDHIEQEVGVPGEAEDRRRVGI